MNRVGTEDLPLFAWPETPKARPAEQRAIPLAAVSIEARYQRWRETPDGERAWGAICRMAQETPGPLSAKALVERVRWELHLRINNSFTAYVARELHESPAFRGRIELRERTAL